MIKSKIDGTICKNNLGLSIHLKKHGLTLLDYYIRYEDFEIPKCVICGNNAKHHKRGLNFKKTCGNIECVKEINRININNGVNSSKNSEETKNKIRKARIKYLKKTRGKGSAWKRRSEGKMSKGEEKLHDIFHRNGVYDKYTVVNEYCEFPYFIDFAFVNEKVAVEYDGRCHFNYGLKRIEHDYRKDGELKKLGWRVYRIPYFELDDFNLDGLLTFIGDPTKGDNFNTLIKYKDYVTKKSNKEKYKDYVTKKKINKYYCDCGNEKTKQAKQCVECSHKKRRKIERPPYEQLVKEIEELGYRGTGRKYGVSDNSIRKWLKNY